MLRFKSSLRKFIRAFFTGLLIGHYVLEYEVQECETPIRQKYSSQQGRGLFKCRTAIIKAIYPAKETSVCRCDNYD